MNTRGILTLTLSIALMGAAAACGGSEPATLPSTATSSAPAATSSAPAATSTTSAAKGNKVAFGTEASVTDTDGLEQTPFTATLNVSLRPGAIADLSGFQLDAQSKTSTPFYVHYTLTNTGSTPLKPATIAGMLDAYNDAGDRASSINLIGDFEKCPFSRPETLALKASIKVCDVYLLPAGQKVSRVEFGRPDVKATWQS